jgi:hypothetical protein
MTTKTGRLLVFLAASLIASVSLSAEKAFDRRFTVVPGGQLTLDADTGSVNVVGRDGNEVVVHAEVDGSDEFLARLNIAAEQTSSGIGITARVAPSGWFHWFDFSRERVHFTIDVPRNYALQLRTSGGNLDVRSISANVRGSTSGGNVVVRSVSGTVKLHTSGGDIDAEGLDGATELGTSGGNVGVADTRGALDVHTSGGDIRLTNIDASVKADTSGGNVSAGIRSNRGISLSTSGGAISLSLPKDTGASLDARTSGGRVSSALPLSSTENADESHLRGALNGGGAQVLLHTSGGDIHIGPLS